MVETEYVEGPSPKPGWRFRALHNGDVHQWLNETTSASANVEGGPDSFERAEALLEHQPADRMIVVRQGGVEIGRMFFSEALWTIEISHVRRVGVRAVNAEARAIFRRFRAMPDSEQIATQFALKGLIRLVRRRAPQHILELGVGLGTITEALKRSAPITATWTGVEREDRFRGDGRLGVVADVRAAVAGRAPVDLLVVDDTLSPDEAGAIPFAARAVAFFEGNRLDERDALKTALFRAGCPWAEATYKPLDRSKGYSIVLMNPNLCQRVWLTWVRLREAALDLLAVALGVRPGWRRRDLDPTA